MFLNVVNVLFGAEDSDVLNKIRLKKFLLEYLINWNTITIIPDYKRKDLILTNYSILIVI